MDTAAAAGEKKNRFRIKMVNAVSVWSPDTLVEICAICRNKITSHCVMCKVKMTASSKDCPVAWGVCNHAFHLHCINEWLRNHSSCPLDNMQWSTLKVEGTT